MNTVSKINEHYDFTPNEPVREKNLLKLESDTQGLIPYVTHWIWISKFNDNERIFPKDAETWKTIAKLN